jgi:CBS domain-containing protein
MVRIEKIMKTNVITADPEVSAADAARIMTNNRVGSVVLIRRQSPVGIITLNDIVGVVAAGKDPRKVKLKDVPKKKGGFLTASPDEQIQAVTKRMIKTGVKRMPVVRAGKLVGIVSDKEILIMSPELISILSEKLKMRVEAVARADQEISGICEGCEGYSDDLRNIGGKWLCESCRES